MLAVQGPSSNRPDAKADVGIFNVDLAVSASVGGDNNDDKDDENDVSNLFDEPSALYNIHIGLQYAYSKGAGSCCASDRADGHDNIRPSHHAWPAHRPSRRPVVADE